MGENLVSWLVLRAQSTTEDYIRAKEGEKDSKTTREEDRKMKKKSRSSMKKKKQEEEEEVEEKAESFKEVKRRI